METALVQSNTFVYAVMALAAIVMLIFFVLVFTVMYFLIRRQERLRGNEWAEAARILGLQLRPATNKMLSDVDQMRNRLGGQAKIEQYTAAQPMFGNLAGRPVEVIIRQAISSRHSVLYTGLVQRKSYMTYCEAVFAGHANLKFHVKSKNGGNFISRALDRGSDIQIGYPRFDQNFMVRGDDPQWVRQMLTSRADDNRVVAERFAANFNRNWIIEAVAGTMVVKFPGMVVNASTLAPALHTATELALRLEMALAKSSGER